MACPGKAWRITAIPPPSSAPPPRDGPGGGRPGEKPDPRRQNELRVNRRIRVKEVFVIANDGSKLGVMNTEDALKRAMDEGLDLVEVNPTSRPPVCKLMDYGKFKYEQKKKTNEAKKKQKVIEVKEVKLRPKTDDHDFDFKVDHIRRFIADGNKSKVTIMFRGREITHPEIGKQVLDRVIDAVKDVAMIESFPRMEGRNMYMVLAPGKATSGGGGGGGGGGPRPPMAPGAPSPQGASAPRPPQGPQGPQGPRPAAPAPTPAPAPQAAAAGPDKAQ